MTASGAFQGLAQLPFVRTASSLARRVESWAGDRWMNVDTGAAVRFGDPRGLNGDACDFQTNAHTTIVQAIRTVVLQPSDVVFVMGCGRGRAVCHFARQPVRKVVGIELDADLCEAARANAWALRGRMAPIEIRQADAAIDDLSDGSVFFLFNPFGERTLRTVLSHIEAARAQAGKRTVIVYANPVHAQVLEESTWLTRCHDYRGLGGLRVSVYGAPVAP
jgi:hypothetical protein